MPDAIEKHIEIKHIEITPGTCGGKPRIAGTRIRVQDIVIWTEKGMSPDEIIGQYPHITLADVHAALTYYHDHRNEIDEHINAAEQKVKQMMANPTLQGPQRQQT